MRKLEGLKPEKVFRYFEDICAIPRGSGNEEAVSRYCMDFAEKRGLTAYRDESNNVIITKESSKGYENAPGVILQGHLDMVCEKNADCTADFTKDGINVLVDGDFVRADGTTLGGDDGIAVAMMLAILDDDSLSHPRLECVFTTEEETGLYGAEALDTSRLKGRRLINIDSEKEGIFTVSCAGGMECDCVLPAAWQEADGCFYEIWVDGLHGGHSGSDIHKERANSNILMGRLLCMLDEVVEFRLAELAGGLMDNAIPRSTRALLCVSSEETDKLEEKLQVWREDRQSPHSEERVSSSVPASQCAKRRSSEQHGHSRSGTDLSESGNSEAGGAGSHADFQRPKLCGIGKGGAGKKAAPYDRIPGRNLCAKRRLSRLGIPAGVISAGCHGVYI